MTRACAYNLSNIVVLITYQIKLVIALFVYLLVTCKPDTGTTLNYSPRLIYTSTVFIILQKSRRLHVMNAYTKKTNYNTLVFITQLLLIHFILIIFDNYEKSNRAFNRFVTLFVIAVMLD